MTGATRPLPRAADQPVGRLCWLSSSRSISRTASSSSLAAARVVGLVGLSGAGKTTTLAAAQLARRRGEGGIGTFAGSYTLLGWHRITRHLQWAPWGDGTFPPHTVLSDSRTPALLHMALRARGEEEEAQRIRGIKVLELATAALRQIRFRGLREWNQWQAKKPGWWARRWHGFRASMEL